MSDYLIRTRNKACTQVDLHCIITAALAAYHLYDGEDYDLIVAAPTDPLLVETDPSLPSGKQLYYVKKLHTEMTLKFASAAATLDQWDKRVVNDVLHCSRIELKENNITRRRVSDIIESLKSLEGLL
jgi:Tat protein secretion system quality control protein TatD with DNase activity